MPVPVKHNGKSQTTQTYKKQDNTKPGNTTSPSPPPRTSKAGTAATSSTGKGGQGDPHPGTSSSSSKKNGKSKLTDPSTHRWLDYYVFEVWGTGCGGRVRFGRRVAPYSCFHHVFFLSNGICVVCRPTEMSLAYCYLDMIAQPFAYKKLYSIVTKQLPSKTIHTMVYLWWKIMTLCMVV